MISKLNRAVPALGLAAFVGFAFTPLGCGSSVPPALSVPPDADLSRQLRACVAEHTDHLTDTQHAISFDVRLTDDGEVESVAVRDETLRDEILDACIAHALRSLTEDALVTKLAGSRPPWRVSSESRALLGQTDVGSVNGADARETALALEECLAAPPCAVGLALIVGATVVAVTIYVYVHAKPSILHPHPPMTMMTSLPIATAEPIPVPMPVPIEASKSKKRRNQCFEMFVNCEAPGRSCSYITDWGKRLCALCREDCDAEKPYTTNDCYRCGFR